VVNPDFGINCTNQNLISSNFAFTFPFLVGYENILVNLDYGALGNILYNSNIHLTQIFLNKTSIKNTLSAELLITSILGEFGYFYLIPHIWLQYPISMRYYYSNFVHKNKLNRRYGKQAYKLEAFYKEIFGSIRDKKTSLKSSKHRWWKFAFKSYRK